MHRSLTALSRRLGFENTVLPTGHAVVVLSTSGCNFSVVVVGPVKGDATKYARAIDDWRARQGFAGDVLWSQEDDSSAASYRYYPGKVGMSHAETTIDLKSLRQALIGLEPRTQFAAIDANWSKIDFGVPPDEVAPNGTRYWNLTSQRSVLDRITGEITVPSWMPAILLAWFLLPPVGVIVCFLAAIWVARRTQIAIVVGGVYGVIGVHGVLFAATVPTRAFDPMTQLWFGQRFSQLALPIIPLFVVVPLVALPFVNRYERRLMGPTDEEKVQQVPPPKPPPVAKDSRSRSLQIAGIAVVAVGCATMFGSSLLDKKSPAREPIHLAGMVLMFCPAFGLRFLLRAPKFQVEPEKVGRLGHLLSERVAAMAGRLGVEPPSSRVLTEVIYGRYGAILDRRGLGVTSQALEGLSEAELDFLIAHELAHSKLGHLVKRRWLLWGPMAVVMILFLALIWGRSFAVSTPGFIFTPFLIPILFTVPYGAYVRRLMQKQELEADQLAVTATGDPKAAIETLRKITLNSSSPGVHDTDMSSHPAVGARIAALSRST
jgi:STE24 endopeptidase